MSLIEVSHLTKDYGSGRGVFDINLTINEGETFGFVGTNGAGKTTLIRQLMGFLKPDSGSVTINNLDCWKDSAVVKSLVGYIPGEIAFPDAPTGAEFLRRQANLLDTPDLSYCNYIVNKLQLDDSANLKRMSKGMKQKTAIAAAFMHNPPILILDEPSTGLDPLMRSLFVDILKEEKKKGKTIFMSSHMFDEVYNTCDRVAMIKDGKIVASVATADIRHNRNKTYKIEFLQHDELVKFLGESFVKSSVISIQKKDESCAQCTIGINDGDINALTKILCSYKVRFFKEIKYSLEQYFNSIYRVESNDQ